MTSNTCILRKVLKKYPPLISGSNSIGKQCAICKQTIREGDTICLIPLGPGADKEAQKKCRENKSYNSIAVISHWSCATGELP